MAKRSDVTLALGAGGARGVAHLGVIEELLRAAFSIERIVGVSIGSLAGAMFALEPEIDRIQERTVDYLLSPEFAQHQHRLFGTRPATEDEQAGGILSWYHRIAGFVHANRLLTRLVRRSSLLPGAILEEVVDHLLPDVDIAEAVVPLSVVAADLHSGRRVVLERGPLRAAVCASSAIPGIFPPVEFEGMLLCDIGVLNSVPLEVAHRYRPRRIVAVDVNCGLKPLAACPTALEVLMRMDEIGEALLREQSPQTADLIIRPDVWGVEWFDFGQVESLIERGRVAARTALATYSSDRHWIQRWLPWLVSGKDDRGAVAVPQHAAGVQTQPSARPNVTSQEGGPH